MYRSLGWSGRPTMTAYGDLGVGGAPHGEGPRRAVAAHMPRGVWRPRRPPLAGEAGGGRRASRRERLGPRKLRALARQSVAARSTWPGPRGAADGTAPPVAASWPGPLWPG